MLRSEAVIVKRCRSRCQGSFDLLYREYRPMILRVAQRIMGNRQDAEDAVQETFARVLTRIHQLHDEASFPWWIRVLSVNVCRDMLRKRNRHHTESYEELCATGRSPTRKEAASVSQDEELIMRELLEDLQRKIGRLKKEHQRVIILRYMDGLSYKKISQLLGCSESLVKSRLHRALKNLRRICKDLESGCGLLC